jgi:AtzE family amidohydrolase
VSHVIDDTAAEIAGDVRHGRRSAVDIAKCALSLVAVRDPALNAFTATLRDRALEAADAVDAAVRQGRDPGPLAGVPFAVKNLYDIEEIVTLAGSIIEAGKPEAARDAALVARLEAAGGVLIGALNMDEYAYGFTTENSHYGATRNPHDPLRISGGSSGGSAAAVAAGLVPISLGSDTNGSIRVPAALCGVYGLKPTFGRLSRRGTKPFVHSLDHTGPFARTIKDLALVYDALQGHDPLDPASAERPVEPVSIELAAGKPKLRAGLLGGWFRENASPEAIQAVEAVASRLQAIKAELPGAKAARAAAFCLTGAEGGALHLDDLRRRPGDFDPATRDRLIAGALQGAHVVARAQRLRRWFLDQALRVLEDFDILLAPATPCPATLIGQAATTMGGEQTSVRASLGLYTQPISFIGLPALTVPVTRKNQLPLGVQMIAAPWREDVLVRAAAWLEAEGVIGARLPSSLPTAPADVESDHDH